MKKDKLTISTKLVIGLFLMVLPLTACASAKNIARQALTIALESSKEESNDDWENDINLRYEAAIRTGDMELTKECIEDGADINLVQDKNPVLYALQNDNYDIDKYLIEQGADSNWTTGDGTSLLMNSFYLRINGYKRNMVTKALIEQGADINYKSPEGLTAIDVVASIGVATVQDLAFLVDNGAIVSANTLKAAINSERDCVFVRYIVDQLVKQQSDMEVSEIAAAAFQGNTATVNKLFSKSISKEDLNHVIAYTAAYGKKETAELIQKNGYEFALNNGLSDSYSYQDVCYYAVQGGNVEMLQYLDDAGKLRYKEETSYREYLLTMAIEADQYESAKYLMEHGADINNESDIACNICAAVANGNIEMIKLLIDHNYHIKNNKVLYYALDDAMLKNQLEVLKYFNEAGYDINTALDESEYPIGSAFMSSIEIVKYMVENGAIISNSSKEDISLLACIEYASTENALYLIEQGAEVNINTYNGTYLEIAAEKGQFEVVKALIEHGADINAVGLGFYPIVQSTAGTHILKYLIEQGVDVNVQNVEYGTSALMAAAHYGNVEGVQMLLDAGSDVTLKNNAGDTALDIARDRKCLKCAELIEAAMNNQQ